MDEAAARAELEQLVAHDQDPVLCAEEIDVLLARARRADAAGNGTGNVATAATWEEGPAVTGHVIRSGDRFWRVLISGTTGSTEPSWPVLSGQWRAEYGDAPLSTVVDGTVVWEDAGTLWAPTWDLNAAAAAGWRMKAGKAAGRFDFGEDGQQFSRSQVMAHCQAMAESFGAGEALALNV